MTTFEEKIKKIVSEENLNEKLIYFYRLICKKYHNIGLGSNLSEE